eukprot:TRINITY_DN1532_c0_g1_i1.p1 TRINITY_DN1532_c0_g1~~TRINITY_DN1532_c0_g1_i1.p1  ORF type:complete len:557 (+),score=213.01 TRINITY_DN1532_c0_g1_i1:103-1671(+)
MARTFTMAEVAKHAAKGDAWIVVDGDVYDVSKFTRMHPGGEGIMLPYLGKDATEVFFELHRLDVLGQYKRLRIGRLEGAKGTPLVDEQLRPGALSKVPYAEVGFWQGSPSPYFTESHRKFRVAFRALLDKELVPQCKSLEQTGKCPPLQLFKTLGAGGYLVSRAGQGPWMNAELLGRLGITLPGGLDPREFDLFHELIAHQEAARVGSPAVLDGIGGGFTISLPAVMHFAQPSVRDRVAAECLKGEKRICLAITEPFVGSDVANLRATARKSDCGRYYIVNGAKKWITGGLEAEYFVTAVRTGGPGAAGVTALLVPRVEGVQTKLIQTAYGSSAGTAYVTYEDAKVPVEYLLGKEGKGFAVVMANFNHERWFANCGVIFAMRNVVEDVFKWAVQRKVFGKPLISQMSVRQKLGMMIAGCEATEAWLEQLTYTMSKLSYQDQAKLAGQHALLKVFATRQAWKVADESAQIFGGRALTKSGMGRKVEMFLRSVKYSAILAGSEEIMADLGVRQAMKSWPKDARL